MAIAGGRGTRRIAAAASSWACLALVLAFEAPAFAGTEAGLHASSDCAEIVRAAVAAEGTRARRWRYAWTAINGGLTAGSLALMPISDRQIWPELAVGGLGSAASAALTFAWPLDVEKAPTNLPQCDPPLLEASRRAYARDEQDRFALTWHLANVGVGVAYLAILGFGWGHWRAGAWTALSAFAVGELQTLTQPRGLVAATW
jgi:hypothetical protein